MSRNAAAGDDVAAAARLGGDALVAGDRRRARAPPASAPGCSTSPRSPSSRSAGPGRGAAARAPVRQPRRPRGRRDHLHADAQPPRRDRVRLHRHARATRSCSRSSPAPRSATTTRAGSAATCPHDGSCRCADVTVALGMLRPVGPAGARDPRAADADDPLDFGYMRMRELAVGDVPVRALRVTFVGELGWELYCPTEYGAGLWRTLWEAGREHGLVAGGYRAIDSLRLEKGYRVWARRHHPRRDAARGGARLLRARGRTLHRRGVRSPGPSAGAASAMPGARGPALGRARQRAGAGRRRDRAAG